MEKSQNLLVTKSNSLIEASYRLGLLEQKILLVLASKIQPTDSDFTTYTLTIKEFADLVGIQGQSIYTDLKRMTFELMKKPVQIKIDENIAQISWLSYVLYNQKRGTIALRFDPFWKPYFLELKREFTSYYLMNIANLKSTYSIRLYELLKQYEKVGNRKFELDELREIIGAEKYSAYGNFKQRILQPAQKEIEEKTDISFNFFEEKTGRRVSRISFIIKSKKNPEKNPQQLALFEPKFSVEDLYKKAQEMSIQITIKDIQQWQEYDEESILTIFEQIKKSNKITNHSAYITVSLENKKNKRVSREEEQNKDTIQSEIIEAFRLKYEKSSRVPIYIIGQEIKSDLIKKAGVTPEEAEALWLKYKSQFDQKKI